MQKKLEKDGKTSTTKTPNGKLTIRDLDPHGEVEGLFNNLNGIVTINSKRLSEIFEIRHDNILQFIALLNIQESSTKLPEVLTFDEMFFEDIYKGKDNSKVKMYNMNRNGFMLLLINMGTPQR